MTAVAAAPYVALLTGGAAVAVPSTGLDEGSGLVASAHRPDVVWVVEDSGEAIAKAFDGAGEPAGSITLDGWDNRDTEALAHGHDGSLWIADIGDNRAARDSVVVHVVDEPEGADDVVVTPTSYRFSYPDGPRDAETFLVDPATGRAYVVSKSLKDPAIYALPTELAPGETHEVTLVTAAPALVTDGAFTPDGERMILRDYFAVLVYDVERDEAGVLAGIGEPVAMDVPDQQQGESVAVTADGTTVLLGSEGADEPIYAVPLPGTEPAAEDAAVDTSPSPGREATSPSASATPHIAEDVVRELEGVSVTLIAMAGVAAVGTAGWLVWARVRRSRAGRRRQR